MVAVVPFLTLPTIAMALDHSQYPALVELVDLMAREDGYPRDELVSVIESANIDQKTLELMDKQWEALPWYKYRKIFISDERINLGTKFWEKHGQVLDKAYEEYGVPQSVIVALIGVETHYGTRLGDRRVLDSLVTLSAAYPRRSKFFTRELRTFLNTTRKEEIDPASVVGSFAGAIGIPQFMPSSYQAYAVDFNGNNQRDLVNEVEDAIGSVANYLAIHGWNRNHGIYAPVNQALPDSAKSMVSKRVKLDFSPTELATAGVHFDSTLASEKVALLALKLEQGNRHIVAFRNFYAITRYNPSSNYAMAVTELAESILSARDG